MKLISIIIPTFNRKFFLKNLLSQLDEQIKKINNFKFKIIVINDGCSDGTAEMINEQFPKINQIFSVGDIWYTGCINLGLKFSKKLNPDYILTLNDDINLKSKYLESILGSALKFNIPIIMGSTSLTNSKPNLITFSGVKEVVWWRYKEIKYHKYLQFPNFKELKGEMPSVVLPGRGMLIDIRIINKIGFFNSSLVQYGSDDEFCLRASKFGYGVYISWNSIIYSYQNLTGTGTPQLKERLSVYLKSFFNKYSRNYYKKYFYICWNYGNKLLFPFTIIIIYFGEIKSYFLNKFIYK